MILAMFTCKTTHPAAVYKEHQQQTHSCPSYALNDGSFTAVRATTPKPSLRTMHLILTICIQRSFDRLCGLVVRVSSYRYRGLGFDSRRYQIFWVVVGLERGPLSLVRSNEELLQ